MTNSLLTQESDYHKEVTEQGLNPGNRSLLLVTIFAQSLLPLVCRHLVTLAFFTAWHDSMIYSFVPTDPPDSNRLIKS